MLTPQKRAEILSGETTTVPLAGQILGVGITCAYKSAKAGDIPTIKIGRKLVVPVPRLRAMLGMSAQENKANAA
jgi:hypothetical protein